MAIVFGARVEPGNLCADPNKLRANVQVSGKEEATPAKTAERKWQGRQESKVQAFERECSQKGEMTND